MVKENHLLEILWERVGCDYLSDLKLENTRPAALREIRSIPKEDYPIKMWNETLSYIFTNMLGLNGTSFNKTKHLKFFSADIISIY